MRPNWRCGGLVLLVLAAGGCAKRPHPPAGAGDISGGVQVGMASWYGPGFHGKRTASGEVYNMNASTAAHKTLPFDTWVRVENLDNGKTTLVRINDRGPFVRGRIIDLSRKAAGDIDMVRAGTARVRLSIVDGPPSSGGGTDNTVGTVYTVQAGAFRDRRHALSLQERLTGYGRTELEEARVSGKLWHRVLVGRLNSQREARSLADRIYRELQLPQHPFVRQR